MVQRQFDLHQSASHSLGRGQAARMGYRIGVSGPRSLPPVSCAGMHEAGRDPTDP